MRFSRQRKAPVNLTLPLTEMLAKVGSAIVRDRPRLYGNNCLCDRLRSAICDPRSSAIFCDRLRSYGNQPLRKTRDKPTCEFKCYRCCRMLADMSVCFQLRILDVTEVFVVKYCPLCLNITSKSETEMFSMNNQRQMFTCESRTVTQRVTKGHQIAVHLQPERRRLLTIQQRNQIIHRTIVDFASIS